MAPRRDEEPTSDVPSQHRAETRTCSRCGAATVTTVPIVLADSTPVIFVSCHSCEHRAWFSGGEELSRETVLSRSAKRT